MLSGYTQGGSADPKYWMEQIDSGLKFRKKQAYEASWARWRQFYRGDYEPGVLPINLFYMMIRSMVPRLYFRNPSASVVPAEPGFETMAWARILERVDNRQIEEMGIKSEIKAMTQDAFMYGTACGKLGFGGQFTYDIKAGNTSGRPLMKQRLEYNDNIVENMPWFMRGHTRNLVVPSGTVRISDARWIAMIHQRHVEDVRADTRFAPIRKRVKPGTFQEVFPTSRAMHMELQKSQLVEFAEIYDKKTKQVIVLAPHVEYQSGAAILYQGPDTLLSRNVPIKTLVFNPDGDSFWGIPDSQIIEPFQLEINEIRTILMHARRQLNVKFLARRGAMLEEEVEKMQSEDARAVAFTEQDPRTAIQKIEGDYNTVLSLTNALTAILQDVRESVGFSRNQFGEYNSRSGDTTATEATIVNRASEIRLDERRDALADLLSEIIVDVNDIMFHHWTTEQVVQVLGPGGVPVWVRFQPTMLSRGKYTVKVDSDNGLPETRQIREQRAKEMYAILKDNPLIDPMKLTSYLLHEVHGTAFDDMMRFLPPLISSNEALSPAQFQQGIVQSIGNANDNQLSLAAMAAAGMQPAA